MLILRKWTYPVARVMIALLFLISGLSKLVQTDALQHYMQAYGVPAVLIWPAAALELGSAVLLIAGLMLQPVLIVLAGWCLLTACIFHTNFSDPLMLMMFLKNVTMAGSFLLLAKTGANGNHLDAVCRPSALTARHVE